jgi:hypothetical protein
MQCASLAARPIGYTPRVSRADVLCSALRQTWHHVPDLDPRHDWMHPRRIVVKRN